MQIVEPKNSEVACVEDAAKIEGLSDDDVFIKLVKTLNHFFPKLKKWLNKMKDKRKNKITYSVKAMIYSGLLLFILKLGAVRQLHCSLNNNKSKYNLFTCFGFEALPHGDTLKNFLKILPPEELSSLRLKCIRRLLRNKVFKGKLFLGKYYLVAIDGTELYKFKERHCDHCLTRKIGDKIEYYHKVLEAKLILPNGLAISLETEFIENISPFATKQDCELNAFYRLYKMLKSNFPQLSMCLLLDSLYACQQVINICEKKNWKYIIRFKEGSIPTLYEDLISLQKLERDNRKECSIDKEEQVLKWINDIEYKGNKLSGLTLDKFSKSKSSKKIKITKFCWLTNFQLKKSNCFDIANYGGRMRWKIENEGFNEQKNGGYNLTHIYCWDYNAMKNFYLLLQLAHMINQLLEKGSLIKRGLIKKWGGIRKITEALKGEFIYGIIDARLLQHILQQKIQIRFT